MASEQLERIGELLIEEGVVTQEELTRAIADSGMKGTLLANVLEAARHTRRADLAAFLAADFRLPKIDDLRKVEFQDEAVRAVPEDLARKHEFVPVARIGGLLCVAKPNYFNRAAVQDVRKATGLKVKVVQADEGQVKAAIEKYYGRKAIDLPSPRVERTETAAFRAVPPPVDEARGREAVPLISMPGGEEAVATRPASGRVKPREEPVEMLAAAKVAAAEFHEVERHPHTRLLLSWDDVFVDGKPVNPIKVG